MPTKTSRVCRAAIVAAIVLSTRLSVAQSVPAGGHGDDDTLAWTADANLGALRLQSSDFRLAGDANVAVSQSWWGVGVWGKGSSYELDSDDRASDTDKFEGAGEAWLRTGKHNSPVQLLIHLSGGGANYSSTVYDRTNAGSFTDETSWMGRGALFVSGLLLPDPSFTAHIAVGGGVQFEWYDTTAAFTGAATVDDTQDLTFIGYARFAAHWIAAKDIISFRARADSSYFKLSRDSAFLGATAGSVSAQNTTSSFSQLEIYSRGFIDIDAASVVGFRPTVHGGLDYTRVSGGGDTSATFVPVFGAGLLRPWM